MVAGANELWRFDAAAGSLTALGTLGTRLRDLDVGSDGVFVVVGDDFALSSIWRLDVHGAVASTTRLPLGIAQVVTAEPGTSRFAIGATLSLYVGYLYTLEGATLSQPKAFATAAGLSDLMWSPSGDALVTSEGDFGSASHSWPIGGFVPTANGWPATFNRSG